MPSLRVIAPGMLTTVQDLGRWGWQNRGVPVAGPMDPFAHRLANVLAGNPPDAATLEMTIVGPTLEFPDERRAAVAGADLDVSVDGRSAGPNSAFAVREGSTFRCGVRRRGARAYLAVSGGIDVPPVLGSRATHLPSAMGGVDGRPLRAGDVLPLGKRGRESFHFRTWNEKTPDPFLRVLPGPQADRLVPDALDVLQSAPYVVDQESNRMAFRLNGAPLRHARAAEMLSDATPFGALQVPSAGRPMLLMADRQTTGGYPIIATVISADIQIAAQLAPGDSVAFVVTTLKEAMAAMIAREQALLALESAR
jgi:antagonist of KipI